MGALARVAALLEAGLFAVAGRWLTIWLVSLSTYVALPWIAPLLSAAGYDWAASWIYLLYRPTCHQLPHHSWFLFGPELTPDWSVVQPFSGVALDTPLGSFHRPLRHPELGYQTAICQRDSAIFGALLIGSIAFAVLRRVERANGFFPFRWYVAAVIPTVIDGLTQLFGLRESTPFLRSATGVLLGLATAAFVLPQLREGFAQILDQSRDE